MSQSSYLGADAQDIASDTKLAADLGVKPSPLARPAEPMRLENADGSPVEQPPAGHVSDPTSSGHTGSAG